MNRLLLTLIMLVSLATVVSADEVMLVTGAKLTGEIVSRDDKEVTIRVTLAGQTLTRKYPLTRVHAIVQGNKREELHPLENKPAGSTPRPMPSSPTTTDDGKTREQVVAIINAAGRTPPDWFASTPLNYPPTLDLSWTQPPPGTKWNNQVQVGAHLWENVNPNPARWRGGIRLLHHMLTVNQGRPDTIEKIQLQIAHMYFSHLQDYARAAFWYRAAGADDAAEFGESAVCLAECYAKLGNREMASQLLAQITDRNGVVKGWAALGEIDRALEIAERLIASDPQDENYLMYAGDAARTGGRFEQALGYYQRVVDKGPPMNRGRPLRNYGRAQASIDAIRLFELSDVKRVPDGVYTSQSLGYEGQVVVEVTVRGQRMTDVRVVQHNEKQFYSSMVDTAQKLIAKQSVKGIDSTSNATITSEAIVNATAKALAGAAR